MRTLQESVMRVRMLPISFVFNRFPRLVRDLGQRLGKKIELKLTGDTTELDKTVLEKIGDPLVHLVRNSIDHGIETPDVRLAAGKPAHGTISLHAYHKGGNVIVEVQRRRRRPAARQDPRQGARARARRRATRSSPRSAVLNLIFAPGFSTADVVSDVSGRGVGMDVVRRNINELGGHVQISSTQRQGQHGRASACRSRSPFSMASWRASARKSTWCPSSRSSRPSRSARARELGGRGGQVFRLRDDYLPIVRLHDTVRHRADHTDLLDGLLHDRRGRRQARGPVRR